MATRRASRKRHTTRRFPARGRRLSARTRAAVVRLPRTHRGAGFRPFAKAWRPKNPRGGSYSTTIGGRVATVYRRSRQIPRERGRFLLGESRAATRVRVAASVLRAMRSRRKGRRLHNPVLQAILPAIAQGAATGLGFAAANRLVGAANPRRSNGRHGVERTTRSRRPSQRLSGAKIIPEAQYMHIPEVREALRAHQEFHGHNPIHLTRVRVADGSSKVTRRYGFVIGEAPEVAYNVWKHAKSNKRGQKGKKLIWVHKFGEGGGKRPLLIHEPKTGLTSYLGGSYRVTDWFHK